MESIITKIKEKHALARDTLGSGQMSLNKRLHGIRVWCEVASPENVMRLISHIESGGYVSPPNNDECREGGNSST
ncbi:hypothetical protein [Candidatus Pantoea formicae]|uniref:hypothetical protein n=1 Tax=Candidatus Pantoea formicae TaxID=2608355 RepID=UPI003EDB523A